MWGAVVLWAYSSANGAKGREIESPWRQEKKKKVFVQILQIALFKAFKI